jgi:hypothetical protein
LWFFLFVLFGLFVSFTLLLLLVIDGCSFFSSSVSFPFFPSFFSTQQASVSVQGLEGSRKTLQFGPSLGTTFQGTLQQTLHRGRGIRVLEGGEDLGEPREGWRVKQLLSRP